ncbi:S-adenosyl-L-methionine-dependent methyltransferases superfamily protein isoform 3 [Carex littledalei]|uniref:S-adenosyl-L-methionine-dependent methyltransferases superfamily protein isoform 3 n=1 Tax=Carex littledalei TaxID=544730 RepID=A0A833V2P1_9POAL|nr:S-adenosyl-L-methionine-dependent methyltransferases superfamily protein isoform 3 [Carex littledalei]
MSMGSTVTTLHPSSLAQSHHSISLSAPRSILAIPRSRLSSLSLALVRSAPDTPPAAATETQEEPFSILSALSSKYNDSIMVIDTPSARFLLLDSSRKPFSFLLSPV